MFKNVMTAFFTKKTLIPMKRVCLRLKELRLQKGKTLDEIAQKTRIDKKHLKALEECRFNDLPTAVVYQKNFIKRFAEALGFDPDPLLAQYSAEEVVHNKKIKHPHKAIKQSWHSNLPLIFRYGAFVFFTAVLIFYLGWQVKRILEPPALSIFSPSEGYITTDASLLVNGETGKEVRVFINGKEVSNNEDGKFKQVIDLSQGVNTINISAQKKHGKITTEVRHVILKQ